MDHLGIVAHDHSRDADSVQKDVDDACWCMQASCLTSQRAHRRPAMSDIRMEARCQLRHCNLTQGINISRTRGMSVEKGELLPPLRQRAAVTHDIRANLPNLERKNRRKKRTSQLRSSFPGRSPPRSHPYRRCQPHSSSRHGHRLHHYVLQAWEQLARFYF